MDRRKITIKDITDHHRTVVRVKVAITYGGIFTGGIALVALLTGAVEVAIIAFVASIVALNIAGYFAPALRIYREYRLKKTRSIIIYKRPGSLLGCIAEILVSPKEYENNIDALLDEWHYENMDEIAGRNRRIKLLAIRYRYTRDILEAIGAFGPLKRLFNIVTGLFKAG